MREHDHICVLAEDSLEQVTGGARVYAPGNNNLSMQLALSGLSSSLQSLSYNNNNAGSQTLAMALPLMMLARRSCPGC